MFSLNMCENAWNVYNTVTLIFFDAKKVHSYGDNNYDSNSHV